MPEDRLPLEISSLDSLLGGGLDLQSLTELFGEGGSGKTNLCAHLSCRVAFRGRWVIYIDTEGLSLDRLSQIARGMGTTAGQVLRRVLLTTPKSLEEQEAAVERACALVRRAPDRFGLVILDSATLLYRLALGQDDEVVARQSVSSQVAVLLHTALETRVPVLFTNQVFRDSATQQLEPIGSSFLNHAAKTVIRLERLPEGWRKATLVKHRSLPEGGTARFRLTERGIESA